MPELFDLVARLAGTIGRRLNLDGSIRTWVVRHPAVVALAVFGLFAGYAFTHDAVWIVGLVLLVIFIAVSRSKPA